LKDGIKTKFLGRKDEIETLIEYIEKENIVLKLSNWIDNDKDNGCHIYVSVLPKKVVM